MTDDAADRFIQALLAHTNALNKLADVQELTNQLTLRALGQVEGQVEENHKLEEEIDQLEERTATLKAEIAAIRSGKAPS